MGKISLCDKDSNVNDLDVSSDNNDDFIIVMPLILSNVEMTPVNQPVIPENFWKDKQKLKACITTDKQIKDQSTTTKSDAQTSAKKP
ncbi:hypothetical protein RhiirC2_798183 [Rhizophagus irregularis]|uniref:Uncharacterized protein n=1 Tax=Rhizophagus irregularis TaxID=588596 RepID=A0A2N1M6U9_9GLOM|nr:hypothetical protein RhiirC2_798183 [Rhizophagus irregularis]